MSLLDDVQTQIKNTVGTPMSITERPAGSLDTSIPEASDLRYASGRSVWATYLYTDMHDSSTLAKVASHQEAARVLRAYLNVSTKIIRSLDGHIRSFDGDRVMGIFAGPNKEDRAVKAAMQIKWAVEHHVTPSIHSQFPSLKDHGWTLKQSSGIATGQTLLARAGFRDNDDMISIGAAPNLAAKLSDIRGTGDQARFQTRIGKGTYNNLTDAARLSQGKNMWTGPLEMPMGGGSYPYYQSNYRWCFS